MSNSSDAAMLTGIPKRYFTSLVRWYWPYLKPQRGLLVLACVAMLVVVGVQAAIPLVTSDILTPPTGGALSMTLLAVLILAELAFGTVAERATFRLAGRSGNALRVHLFQALLSTPYLQQPRLYRSSVVGRHTTDVDNVIHAVEGAILKGLPAVVQVAVSLVLLTYIDVRSGLAMTMVTVGFLVARARVGRVLLRRDRLKMEASSAVGDLVDETVSMTVPMSGLAVQPWVRSRFGQRADALLEATYRQDSAASGLGTIATTAGLIGLFVVVASANALGGAEIAQVAAALLYVTTIVTGLTRLSPWVRQLQLAVVSRRRIDQVLHGSYDSSVVAEALASPSWRTLATGHTPELAGMVGLVTTPGLDDDHVLTALTGTPDVSSWRVSLFGAIVRAEGVRPDVLFVPDEPLAFAVPIRDHLRAVDPHLDDRAIGVLLTDVGLHGVPSLDVIGSELTSHERARLLLAMALAVRPRMLLVGALAPLADIDTAAPLLAAARKHAVETVVVAVRTLEVATVMDRMLFVTDRHLHVGTHSELLATSQDYSRLWSAKVLADRVDLSELGITDASQADVHARLVTERFSPGEVIYRQDDQADRILFIISGRVEITVTDGVSQRRVAVLGPGNHCGDLQLTTRETRAETAVAVDEVVVRSLTRGAYAAGVMGLLDRPVLHRRIIAELLRGGACAPGELAERLPDATAEEMEEAVAALISDGSVVGRQGELRVVLRRRVSPGLEDIHDRLRGL